jgi:hypothetical protein
VPLSLAYAEELYEAVRDRDVARVRYLTERARTSWIPREVREEALAVAQQPRQGHRVPIKLLTYVRKLEQVVLFDGEALSQAPGAAEGAHPAPDPDQLELPGTESTKMLAPAPRRLSA